MTELANKTVLITGAASGLGRMLAEKAARRGARLVLWDVNRDGLETLRAGLTDAGHQAFTYRVDLADGDAIRTAAKRVAQESGPVDVLVNNAGIVSGKPLLEISEEEIRRSFAINTLALFWTTRAFLPAMIERGSGHIVTMASAGGLVGTARLTDYCASKFAAVGFDESLRLELRRLGHKGIRTTVICPFYIDTGMFAGVKSRFSWLLPILTPDYATDRILRAIERNRRRLIMPRFVHASFLARLLPPAAFDFLMDFFGINRSMDEFTGRHRGTS